MKRLALLGSTLLLTAAILTGCATTNRPRTEADFALQRINAERMRNAQPAKPEVSTQEVIGAIIALPITIPLAAMVDYSSSTSVHCHSWTYKDAYHASCY